MKFDLVKQMMGVALVCGGMASAEPVMMTAELHQARIDEFTLIAKNIARYHPRKWDGFKRVEAETYRRDALILAEDKTPVDVILRRTHAAIEHRNLVAEAEELRALKQKNQPKVKGDAQLALFLEVAELRRRVLFSDPLVDFDSMLFIKRDPMVRGFVHMVDQYFGFNQRKNGGVYKLENPFSEQPQLVDVLADKTVEAGRLQGKPLGFDSGAFLSLDLDYDAGKILFAFSEVDRQGWQAEENWDNQPWKQADAWNHKRAQKFMHYLWKPESSFHIFEADLAGGEIKQLTDGTWDEFDPCYLPNGRIVFISARCGGNQRCGYRYLPTYTLHTMMADGADVQQLSFHDTNEWFPSVDNDGMLIYTRWDYVDRDANIAHHLWSCYPDGRNPRSMHGNYPDIQQTRPWFEGHIRAIPDSSKYVAVAAPHHGDTYGSLILIDQSVPDDRAMSQVKRIAPLSAFPECEITAGEMAPTNNRYKMSDEAYQADWNYATPWPLSDDLYLCVHDPYGSKMGVNRGTGNNFGIYLVDAFGNRELVYRDPNISCMDPMPLRPRVKPHTHPVQTTQMLADRDGDADLSTATVAVLNVYESEFPIPDGVRVKELRVVNLFPKTNHNRSEPMIGAGLESLARGVLGTVPVEEDGSVYFECPTGTGIYFQLLDENGVMVHTMRSATYLHPGEQMTCIGCHENKWAAPKNRPTALALQRAPSKLTPEASGSYPLTFPRLVQPVLDRHCVACHEKEAPKKSLRGDAFGTYGWSNAMQTLKPLAWTKHGSMFGRIKNGRSYSIPMQEGARVSKLYPMLADGHHGVKLSSEEMRRITLWLDCNSNFYGAYDEPEKQAQGEVILPQVGLPKWTKEPTQFIR